MRGIKMRWICLAALAASALLAGCQQEEEPLTIQPDQIDRVILFDTKTRGMGGRNVFIRADRTAWLQEVRPSPAGFDEARYPFELTEAQYRRLVTALSDPELLALARRRHPAVPDGSLVTIGMVLDSGEHVSLVKSRRAEVEPFDKAYQVILDCQKDLSRLKPAHQGRLDWFWRPEGFGPPAPLPSDPPEDD
jgi:hypothetical protein